MGTQKLQSRPKPAIRTPYNKYGFNDNERNTQKSKTKPNDAFTVLQILQRHREGRPLGVGRNVQYLGEDHPTDGVDPGRMELTDRMEQAHEARENAKALTKKYKDQEEAKRNPKAKELGSPAPLISEAPPAGDPKPSSQA